jgi:hypothetical protein
VNQAEVPAVTRDGEGPLDFADEPDRPQRGHVRPDLEGDVNGMACWKSGPGPVGDAGVGAGLPAGAGTTATPAGRVAEDERQLATDRAHGHLNSATFLTSQEAPCGSPSAKQPQ